MALGPEKTRTELLKFMKEIVYDEDEILLKLAEELGCFIPLVGGPNYAHTLLELLEVLAAIEETVVRDKAVEVLNKIAEVLPKDKLEEYLALIRRLSIGEWFTARVSVAAMFATVYGSYSEKYLELNEINFIFA